MHILPWTNALLSLLFPNSCLFCGTPVWVQPPNICDHCRDSLSPVFPDYFEIHRMKTGGQAIDRTLIAYAYDAILQELFERMKYNGEKEIATLLGKLAFNALAEFIPAGSLFIPVPLHPKKRRQRGYNQAELIAKSFASVSGGKVLNAAKRIRYTETQTRLSKEKRKENVSGAFKIIREYNPRINNRPEIFLVDDVITTGATLNELAATFRKEYPALKISVLAVATPLVKDIY